MIKSDGSSVEDRLLLKARNISEIIEQYFKNACLLQIERHGYIVLPKDEEVLVVQKIFYDNIFKEFYIEIMDIGCDDDCDEGWKVNFKVVSSVKDIFEGFGLAAEMTIYISDERGDGGEYIIDDESLLSLGRPNLGLEENVISEDEARMDRLISSLNEI
jgi:hypothetical protein